MGGPRDAPDIRLIQKIEREALEIAPLLEKFHPKVLRQAAQSLTLLTWSVFAPGQAPPLEFLIHRRGKQFYGRPWERRCTATNFEGAAPRRGNCSTPTGSLQPIGLFPSAPVSLSVTREPEEPLLYG
jgi:hypothetical protein